MFHRPAVENLAQVPVVIMLHGFTGSRVESHRLFFHISEELERMNVGSLRFDFLGCGESDGDYQEMTVTSLILQAQEVLRWLNHAGVSNVNVTVLGYSLGGLVASELVRADKSLGRAILVSPSRPWYLREKHKERFSNKAAEAVEIGGYLVGRGFYDNLVQHLGDTPFSDEQQILVIHGTDDNTTPSAIGEEYLSIPGGTKKFIPISGADHSFNTLAQTHQLLEHITRYLS
ncbi:alpha/beta fold hydrolase [Alicyclobacillus sp. SO9]|uniref:alpha/beta fold hydrolase n=1 Tax=Alicyclobacillus sp. SO9 TaxID=2665646 RepID=UPI001E5E76D2|nr:alpha/beta hydrolase [Alicyclobacillus sp. SO9]